MPIKFLDSIDSPADLKKLHLDDLPELCEEIRSFFIEKLLINGGHFSANLGVVELTVALHYVFDFKSDRLVWDVGHQAYIHKLLTGRKSEFDTIRRKNGLSGFPNLSESEYDHFGTGHSSTSISAVLGMAEASLTNNAEKHHIAVIGDGSLSGGMAYEALNNLGVSAANVLVIVNDNQMGIDPNLGAINTHLANIESAKTNIFENLGIEYSGPFDGHDVKALVQLFQLHEDIHHPRIVHLKTVKGKGYKEAEEHQTKWHSVKYVKLDAAKPQTLETKPLKFQDVFGHTLLELAKKDERIVGITPAMPSGSSMNILMKEMPERVFDVGIAEQHAVTFSAGLALEGKRPFCNLYSSFAQRAYDQIIHDVALQNIPVIFCLDRAGLVGEDGATHQGIFDIAYLKAIPNLIIISPMDEWALRNAMYWAVDYDQGPVVIRYPRGAGSKLDYHNDIQQVDFAKARVLSDGSEIAVISLGTIGVEVQAAIENGKLQTRLKHIDLNFVKPLDISLLKDVFEQYNKIICIEEGILRGGIAEEIASLALAANYSGKFKSLGINDEFVEHASVQEQRESLGLDAKSLEILFKHF